jgi:hypothetical protein
MLPFPLARRVDLIRRQAERFVDQETAKGAEKNLAHALDVQRQAFLRKGIPPEVVEAQVSELEGAIRARAWHVVFSGEVTG